MSEKSTAPEGVQTSTLQERRETLLETTRDLLESGDQAALRLILNSQHPADLAEMMGSLDEEEQQAIFEVLAEPLAADVLAEMDAPTVRSIAEEMDSQALSDLVEEMEPDDAADLLGELPEEQSTQVLDLMEESEAEEVRELLAHDEDTGGGIMTSRLIAVREEMTVADAIAYLREWADEDEIFYIYVVDGKGRLIGTVSLRRLILAEQDTLIRDLAERDPISVRTDTDQEEIARLFLEYDLLALPVVDEEGRLVGRVTVDDVVEVMEEEATEDMYVMAATSAEELEERSVIGVVRRRLPWLLVCLAGTFLSGSVLSHFQSTLARVGSLVMFVPAIMAMGGNSGLQSTTVTVRGLATGQLQSGSILGRIFRELRIALVIGLMLGGVIFTVTFTWTHALLIAVCVGLALMFAISFAAVLGAVIPLLFRAIGVDPAVASGPLITTLNDALSLGIYFTIANLLLRAWG